MPVTVVDHPLAAELLARLRDETTDRAAFRQAMDDLAGMLVYEACRDLGASTTARCARRSGPAPARRVEQWPVVVPILRAGLGMMNAVHRLLPDTDTAFIGVARDETTFAPEPYMLKVPDRPGRPAGARARPDAGHRRLAPARLPAARRPGRRADHRRLRARRPRGRRAASRRSGLGVHVVTAAIDDHLNDHAFIVPGLGDAGDRLFGTA